MFAQENITSSNWNKPPYNRKSFQQVQKLFPTCHLQRDMKHTQAWSEALQSLETITFTGTDGGTQTVEQIIERSFTDSFAVLHQGKIITEQYFNDMDIDSHHLVNSVTKSFVGVLAGIAVEQGRLDPTLSVVSYLPELTNSAWTGCTVRHLLDMTAGAAYLEEYENVDTDFWHEAATVGWCPSLVKSDSPKSLWHYACSLYGQDQNNGEKFHYRTVTTNVLGMVIAKAMAQPLDKLIEQHIWSKLGTRNDASIVADAVGFPYVGAGMSACTRDLLSFGKMIIDGGESNGQSVVPKSWIIDTLKGDDNSKRCFSDSDYGPAMPGFHYRNQFWVKDSDKGVLVAIGIHGQIIYMDRSKDLVIVKLSSQPEPVDLPMFLDCFAAMDAIANYL